MKTITFASFALLALPLAAQTQTLRGKVEDVRGTQNQFYLDGTRIPVVSTALNLNLIQGQESILQVVNVGTSGSTVLRVDAAVATTKTFDIGNLRFGQSARWEINATGGSFAMMFLNWTDSTAYAPFGQFGVWLAGNGAATIASGFTNGQAQFEINFTMPNIPSLLGVEMTGQGLVDDHGTVFFTNLDSKEIEN